MKFRIINLTMGAIDPFTMEEPARRVAMESGAEIEFSGYSSDKIGEDVLALNEVCQGILEADFVVIRCLMDPTRYPFFKKLENCFDKCRGTLILHTSNADVNTMYRPFFKGTDEEFSLLSEFISNRSTDNDAGLTAWFLNRKGLDVDVPEPVVQRKNGLYHPDFGRDVTMEEFLPHLGKNRIRIGVLFVATHWIYRNMAHIDSIVRKGEARGLDIIPVFFNASNSNTLNEKDSGKVCEEYFIHEGQVLIDALIMITPFSQTVNSRDEQSNFYRRILDVPVIQSMMIGGRFTDFEDSKKPGYRKEFAFQSSWAEMDGQIISVPSFEVIEKEGGGKRNVPLGERIDHLLDLAENWGRLRHTPAEDRRIAIIMYQSRPDLGAIGSAAGLDGPESTVRLLHRLKAEGYVTGDIPEDGRGLVDDLLQGVTNNLDWSDSDTICEKSVDLVTPREYEEYYAELSEFNKTQVEKQWGKPTGNIMTDRNRIIIPGKRYGNILVTLQPLRAWMELGESVIHDPELTMGHQYLGFYRWLQHDYKADALVHMGTHGTLEWLPGKGNTMSAKCNPDLVLNAMPNIYPFQIDDPGEGIQAKRRSEAVLIGYNCTPMMRSGTYGDYEVLEGLVQEYLRSSNTISKERAKEVCREVLQCCEGTDLLAEVGLGESPSDGELITKLPDINDILMEMKNELVRDGLHVLGDVPDGKLLAEYVYAFTRSPHGGFTSLQSCILESDFSGDPDSESFNLLNHLADLGFNAEKCCEYAKLTYGANTDGLVGLVDHICSDIVPRIRKTSEEMDSVITALGGHYVMPGPSGAPTRSGADILPSGRNYYGLDPQSIPSRSAWEIGRRNADQMIERYLEDRGCHPRQIALIVWATDTLKTNGDDIAYALWLMGVKPVWSGDIVSGLEVIPLSELGRARIDVSIRITGLFRDTFPNLIDLLDDAVNLVCDLDEEDSNNAIAGNVRREIAEAIAKGTDIDTARRNASIRIFGNAPGTYGSGMNKIVESSDWEDSSDFGKAYSDWGCFAFGRNINGIRRNEDFRKRFGSAEAIVKNLPDKEIGMVDMDDVYGYLGGMTAFIRNNGNEKVEAYVGDTSDTSSTRVRTSSEALKLTFRSQVQNPRFIRGLMRHGYAGVNEVSKMTEYLFGWDSTSDIMEKWMYDGLAESYLFDDEVYQWMKDENPYALSNVLKRLHEAIERGMWDADEDMRKKLEDLFMEAEERIEEMTDR